MAIHSADDEELEPEDFARAGPHRPNRPAKDASTNEIVAWTLSETMGMPFVVDMLRKLDSVGWLPRTARLHSDQGCHYTSYEYRKYLSDRDICQSMSRRVDCWDNAPMESFFGHAKDELRLRRCRAFNDVVSEISDYIDYYNSWRPQAGLGKMTPAEFRDCLLARPIRLPPPPRRGERKREPLARGSRFSIDPGFLNVPLTWGPH